MRNGPRRTFSSALGTFLLLLVCLSASSGPAANAPSPQTTTPAPQLRQGHSVDWWFVFKLNSGVFPGCGGGAQRQCIFGGKVQKYPAFGQQFVYASSDDRSLQKGSDCAGDSTDDPI